MKIFFKAIKETRAESDALILPFCESEWLISYDEIDGALKGLIRRVLSAGEFTGKHGQLTLLHTSGMIKPERVLLVGLGKKEELSAERVRQAGGKAATFLSEYGLHNVSVPIGFIRSLNQPPEAFVEGCLLASYRFRRYKKENGAKEIRRLDLIGKPDPALRDAVRWVEATAEGVGFARDLVNTPANDLTPSVLAKAAKSLAGKRVTLKVLNRKEAGKEGMGAFLAVARGSHEQPRFIVIRYKGKGGGPVVLIGKSITFDSGGISIKPSDGMEKMKYDMAGGSAVLAVIKVASALRLPVHIVGILPATENMPGGGATKPGDIVRTVTGKTVEIVNTDAEGRLALADAIGFAKKLKPRFIIDIATLTGACSVALGNEAIAMMGNDGALMESLKAAGDATYERVWPMPLFAEYLEYIQGDIADLKNSGGKNGSLVTAGYFLREFAGDTPWVHLDIAGTAWNEKDRPYGPKGASGVGVRLLLRLIKEMNHEHPDS